MYGDPAAFSSGLPIAVKLNATSGFSWLIYVYANICPLPYHFAKMLHMHGAADM